MRSITLASAILVALAVLGKSTASHACGTVPSSFIAESIPADAEEHVPTDVVPWLLTAGTTATLIDAQGDVVPSTTRGGLLWQDPGMGYLEVVPSAPLEPNAEYTVITSAEETPAFPDAGTSSISFTTGNGILNTENGPHGAPQFWVALFDTGISQVPCSVLFTRYQGCLASVMEGMFDIRISVNHQETEHLVGPLTLIRNLPLGFEAGEVCLEIRTRDISGNTSEPAKFCTNTTDLPRVNLGYYEFTPYCGLPQITPLYVEAGDITDGGFSSRPHDATDSGLDAGHADSGLPGLIGVDAAQVHGDATTVVEDAANSGSTHGPHEIDSAGSVRSSGCSLRAEHRGTGPTFMLPAAVGLLLFARRRRSSLRHQR